MEKIGFRLKKIRKLLNMSQEVLAKELGITKQAISNMETGKSFPSMALLSKLLIDYDVNINYIIAGVGDVFCGEEKTSNSLRASIIKEVESLLDVRGIK